MTPEHHPTFNFERELKLEAERILKDLIFQRAPTQSQLLKFLVDRAVAGIGPPSQYEIAVDGLGKPVDYDLENDSYPRVQVSRLRKSLENFYARNLPGNGLRIQLDQGSYRLSLEPAEKTDGRGVTDLAARDQYSVLKEANPRSSLNLFTLIKLATGGLVAILLVGWASSNFANEDGPSRPKTALVVDLPIADASSTSSNSVVEKETVQIIAERQIQNSFVSSPVGADSTADSAKYTVRLSSGFRDGKRVLLVTLAHRNGNVIFTDSVEALEEDAELLSAELEASLVYITSPTGIIAREELRSIKEPSSSAYACFLSIENRRSKGEEIAALVDRCIAEFSESEYRAFWHARRAFAFYQKKAMKREPIIKAGEGWQELRRAFEADEFNAFANFVAAKVELSQGRCGNAAAYIERALERGSSYPVMVAAAEANGLACFSVADQRSNSITRLRALADHNPDPDPLLHSYLVLGLLSAGDKDAARAIAGRLVLDQPSRGIETTSQLIRLSLEDTAYARSNQSELRQAVYALLWNESTTNRVVRSFLD